MGLVKTGYRTQYRGKTKFNVPVDEDGLITSTADDDAVGTVRLTFDAVSADNGLVDNNDVIAFFLTIAGGSFDSLSNQMSVVWTAGSGD